jgi:hypothetical protein
MPIRIISFRRRTRAEFHFITFRAFHTQARPWAIRALDLMPNMATARAFTSSMNTFESYNIINIAPLHAGKYTHTTHYRRRTSFRWTCRSWLSSLTLSGSGQVTHYESITAVIWRCRTLRARSTERAGLGLKMMTIPVCQEFLIRALSRFEATNS